MLEKPDKPSGISCDPRIQFGAPCVAGRRVTTRCLYSMYLGMEKICTIADSYGVHEDDVIRAVKLEEMWAEQAGTPCELLWNQIWSTIHDLWWRFRGWLGEGTVSPRRILKYAFKGICIIVLYEVMQEVVIGLFFRR